MRENNAIHAILSERLLATNMLCVYLTTPTQSVVHLAFLLSGWAVTTNGLLGLKIGKLH